MARQMVKPENTKIAPPAGDLHKGNSGLNTYSSIYGKVVHGQHLGATLGFPTANLRLGNPQKLLLTNGVYAVKATSGKQTYNGVANLGIRPTLNQKELMLEVYLFNFSGNLYGKFLRIFFIEKIRDEKKFSGVEALKKNIQKDVHRAETILAGRF